MGNLDLQKWNDYFKGLDDYSEITQRLFNPGLFATNQGASILKTEPSAPE